jgi:hypothetical protein
MLESNENNDTEGEKEMKVETEEILLEQGLLFLALICADAGTQHTKK